jgi:outer membrane protein assembly factor BamB
MRLSKNDYKLLGYFIIILLLCWGGRFLLFLRPTTSFSLSQKWRVDLGHSTYERPAYHNGLVLFPANVFLSSRWYGVEADSGQVFWSQPVTQNSFRRCLTDDYLVVSGSSSFLALRPKTGKIIWSLERAGPADCSDTSVFAILPRSNLRAHDISTGETIWLTTTPFETFGGVIYNPATKEVIADGAAIVDPASGRLLRTFEPSFVGYAPEQEGSRGPVDVINNNQLFIGGTVRDAQTGEIIHKEDTYHTGFAPTVTTDAMYLSSGNSVVAYDRTNYDLKWVYSSESIGGLIPVWAISPVGILDGVGYVIYSDATLRAIDLETGQELGYWQPGLRDRFFWPVCVPVPFPFCASTAGVGMAASADTLFVSFGDGKLYAFGK